MFWRRSLALLMQSAFSVSSINPYHTFPEPQHCSERACCMRLLKPQYICLVCCCLFWQDRSSIAGFLLHGSTLKLGRHYDTALLLESILLFVAFAFLFQGSFFGHFFASAACGLQNALATTYSGAVIRTTHVTGIFTDLGIMIGAFLRGDKLDKRKIKLFTLIIAGFILGGTAGVFLYRQVDVLALLLPASICMVIAFGYRVYTRNRG